MNKKKQTNYRHRRRAGRTLIPVLSLTLLTVVLAAGIAGLWQLMDPVEYQTPDVNPFAKEGEPSVVQPPIHGASSSSQDSGASSESPASQPAESPSTPEETTETDGFYQVPKGEWAPSEYFDDAIFVGDSLTEGIKHYDVMSNTTVLAGTGVNLDSIYTKQVIKTGDGDAKISIMDAVAAAKPGKIYLMMGANSLDYQEEDFLRGYGRIVDSLQQMHPDAVIYVQSIMPVTKAYADSRPNFSNERIDRLNLQLSQMAKEKGVYFVNTAESVKNGEGALPAEASSDGIHFGTTYYRKWFDYLREHTAAQ